MLRFRFSIMGGLSPTGLALNGEVEDYEIEILLQDFGDAPDPLYPTLRASTGASHKIDWMTYLGSLVDWDVDGQPTADATGDDMAGEADDDGVVFTSQLAAGQVATMDVEASVGGVLNAWIDFNANGDWNDPGEQVCKDRALAAGVGTKAVAHRACPSRVRAR